MPTAAPLTRQAFTVVGDLAEPRSLHTAALLPNGRVFVAGGNAASSSFPVLASSEIYNPDSRTFAKGPNLNAARQTFAAVTLGDGRVLVSGGVATAGAILQSAEVCDPVGGGCRFASDLLEARAGHAMVLLNDGLVVVIGGRGSDGKALASTELFDPASLTFASGPSLVQANASPQAVLLPGGSILVAGNGTVQVLDTDTNSFAMLSDRTDLPEVPVLLSDGKALLTGGIDHERLRALPTPPPNSGSDRSVPATDAAMILDLATGVLTLVGPMQDARMLHEALLLTDGRVLIAGGVPDSHFDGGTLASAEIFDPETNTFSMTGPMTRGRVWFTLTLLLDGDALAVGGSDSPGATAEVYHP
ncbi:MAG: hypothetical protein IT302_08630 [Dehalococcoidia bacterium]|nr:hypothetical protein [Dehalococcoidia bacterium]